MHKDTVITCFPKRFGRNKPDVSAVQKCIRTRLRAARIDEVRSVYDLAIIIIDQCSRVFFDRTQSEDLQPQVMDCFGNAIGRVVSEPSYGLFTNSADFSRPTSKALHLTIFGNVLGLLRSDTILVTNQIMVPLRSHKMSYSISIPKESYSERSKILWMRYSS
jgi:hypothetical protein